MNWIKNLLKIGVREPTPNTVTEQKKISVKETKPKKTRKSSSKTLTPKEAATRAREPYVEIIKIDIDKDNPSYGSFELDWNEFFIKKLRSMGYPGETDETVVDLWFQSVCRNILMETYEQDVANRSSDNVRYINRKNIGNGKTEIS